MHRARQFPSSAERGIRLRRPEPKHLKMMQNTVDPPVPFPSLMGQQGSIKGNTNFCWGEDAPLLVVLMLNAEFSAIEPAEIPPHDDINYIYHSVCDCCDVWRQQQSRRQKSKFAEVHPRPHPSSSLLQPPSSPAFST